MTPHDFNRNKKYFSSEKKYARLSAVNSVHIGYLLLRADHCILIVNKAQGCHSFAITKFLTFQDPNSDILKCL